MNSTQTITIEGYEVSFRVYDEHLWVDGGERADVICRDLPEDTPDDSVVEILDSDIETARFAVLNGLFDEEDEFEDF